MTSVITGCMICLGNVQEWTGSWYKAYKGNTKPNSDFGERYRVLRGLSSNFYGSRGHVWDRSAYLPKALYGYGCRCAKDATAEEAAKAGRSGTKDPRDLLSVSRDDTDSAENFALSISRVPYRTRAMKHFR